MAYTNQGLVGTAQGPAANQPFSIAAQAYPGATGPQMVVPMVANTAAAPQPFSTAAQAYPVQPIVVGQLPWWYYYDYGGNNEGNNGNYYYYDHNRHYGYNDHGHGNGGHGHGGHGGHGNHGGSHGGSHGGGHGNHGGGHGGGHGGRLQQGILEMLNSGTQAVQLSAQNNNVKYCLPPTANAVSVQRTDSSNNSVAVYPPAGQTIEGQPFMNLGTANCNRYARLVRHGRDWKRQA